MVPSTGDVTVVIRTLTDHMCVVYKLHPWTDTLVLLGVELVMRTCLPHDVEVVHDLLLHQHYALIHSSEIQSRFAVVTILQLLNTEFVNFHCVVVDVLNDFCVRREARSDHSGIVSVGVIDRNCNDDR